jgi:hypothetical protein
MTEQIFIDLGFQRNEVTPEDSGYHYTFYYYSVDIGDVCIMSNSDDEAAKNGWEAMIFDSRTLSIKGAGDLEDLIRILRNNTHD